MFWSEVGKIKGYTLYVMFIPVKYFSWCYHLQQIFKNEAYLSSVKWLSGKVWKRVSITVWKSSYLEMVLPQY